MTARGAIEKGGVSGLLRGRRSEEMTQSNTSSLQGQKYLLSHKAGDGN